MALDGSSALRAISQRDAHTVALAFALLTLVAALVLAIALPSHATLILAIGLAVVLVELAWRAVRASKKRRALKVEEPIVVAMFAVVTSFCVSVAFIVLRLEPIQQQGAAITENALPSIEHLFATRTALEELRVAARESLLHAHVTLERERVEAARRRVDSELSAYRALPKFPGELDLVADVDRAMVAVDESIRSASAESAAARSLPGRVALYDDLAEKSERADGAVVRLEVFNADHVHREAARMMAVEHHARRLGAALALVSVMIALLSAVLVIRNVGRQARLLDAHNELLAARADELEAFAGRVAHDLKNPLSAMTMRIWTAQRRADANPRELLDDLDKISRQSERMRKTIDGLLEFARAGANPERTARADVAEVLEDVVAEARPSTNAARAVLRVAPVPPVEVACTPEALTSVLSNLVGNAVKYIVESKRPERVITVTVEERDEGVRFEIEDTGPGLPEGFEQRLFQPFVRLRNTSQPGTGLGLATVKKIVDAYGGRIGARSSEGRGATFWFTLPKAAS